MKDDLLNQDRGREEMSESEVGHVYEDGNPKTTTRTSEQEKLAESESDTMCGVRECPNVGIYEYSGSDGRITPILCASHFAKRKHSEPENWSMIEDD